MTHLSDTQLDQMIDELWPTITGLVATVWEPFADGFDVGDLPRAGIALMAGLMSMVGPMTVADAEKRALVLRGYDRVMAAKRADIDIPWAPDWFDDPLEDALIAGGRDALELIYSVAADVPPFDRILG